MFDFRPKHNITVRQTAESFPCAVGENLLRGMTKLGRKGIPVGCVNGGCGVCKVKILAGQVERLGPISRAHVSQEEEAQGCTLACRVTPASEVLLEVVGKFEKPFRRGHEKAMDPKSLAPSLSTKET